MKQQGRKAPDEGKSMEVHLADYAATCYPLHMPGHKRRSGCLPAHPEAIDVTEVPGTDDLYSPEGIIDEALAAATAFYGTRKTYFLLNGSTGGILTALAALADPGDKVLVMRSCHQAVYHGIEINGLVPVYIYPEPAAPCLAGGVPVERVRAMLEEHPDIKGCILTSPTYEGLVLRVVDIAEAVHEKGCWLLVDEAHGAHFNYAGAFPDSAIDTGADLVVQSLHKTLPAMTQTALLHVAGGGVDLDRLEHFYQVYQTSSPSYVLMASIDNCLRFCREAADAWSAFFEMLQAVGSRLSGLKKLQWIREENLDLRHLSAKDPTKVLISTMGTGITGRELDRRLRESYGFQVELSGSCHLLAMLTVSDDADRVLAFADALLQIDRELAEKESDGGSIEPAGGGATHGETVADCSMAQAWQRPGVWLPLEEAEGRTVQVPVIPYPPGIPLLASGERVRAWHILELESAAAAGTAIKGLRREGQRIHIKTIL